MELDPRLRDFRNFQYMVWSHLGYREPSPLMYDIGYWIQHGPPKLVIEGFRGVSKSYICCSAVPWFHLLDPTLNVMIVSASKTKADQNAVFIKRLIDTMPVLEHLQPRQGQRDSTISFDVGPAGISQSPSVYSVGITGQITGSRADIIIADDVEVPSNSATQTQREKLSTAIQELYGAVLKPGGRIIYLGTPQTAESIYNDLPQKGYKTVVYPVLYPEAKEMHKYVGKLAPMLEEQLAENPELAGEPTNPERFPHSVIAEKRGEYARDGFALQFMLDTSLSDANRYPLKLSDLVVMDLSTDGAPEKIVWASSPDQVIKDLPNVGFAGDRLYRPFCVSGDQGVDGSRHAPYTGSVIFVDPSGRGKDETSYAVVKMLNGQLFLVDCGGFLGGYETETLEALATIAWRHKVNYIRIESNFGDGMFEQLFKPVLKKKHPCTTEGIHVSGQKEARIIDTLAPVMQSHKLVIDSDVIQRDYDSTKHLPDEVAQKYQLMYQMTHITRQRGALVHDDRLDALAGAVAYWVEQMGRDVDEAVETAKNERLDEELKKFTEGILGGSMEEPTWLT